MTSISGYIFLNDYDLGRKYGTRVNRTTLEIKVVDGTYTVLLKMFPNHLKYTYLLHDLDNVKAHEEKFVMKFLKPNHELLIMTDDVDKVMSFLKNLKSFNKNLNLNIGESFLADALKPFGNINNNPTRMQNFKAANLRMMEMNSISSNKSPLEMIYLKKLKRLSVSNNKLVRVPRFIGELKDLKTLKLDGNSLWYFPESLLDKVFEALQIFNDRFRRFFLNLNKQRCENAVNNGLQNPSTLLDLSISSLITNNINFKRQEIPRDLWDSYDVICRCKNCKRLFVYDAKNQKFTFSPPKTVPVVRLDHIYCQYFKCPSCVRLENNNV